MNRDKVKKLSIKDHRELGKALNNVKMKLFVNGLHYSKKDYQYKKIKEAVFLIDKLEDKLRVIIMGHYQKVNNKELCVKSFSENWLDVEKCYINQSVSFSNK